MKSKKTYNILIKFIHIITPIIILLYAYSLNLTYNKNDDPGGWGGLALAGNIILSFGWILTVLFIVLILNAFCKNKFSKGIIKLIISILNIIIWLSNTNFFVQNDILIIINIFLIVTTSILLFLNKRFLQEVD